MDVLIPEIRNSSPTSAADRDNVTTNLTTMVFDDDAMRNCTPLNGLDLVDVFAKMDVGSTEFWGSSSIVWMTFFIMYCILFYAALFSVFFCWGYIHIGLVYSSYCFCIHRRRNLFSSAPSRWLRRRIRRVSYLLALQILWFVFSFVHGILIISSVASGSDNDVVAVATRTIETVTSFSFVNIIITAAQLFSNPCFSVIWMVLYNLIIYLLGMAIIVISLAGDSIVVLIGLRSAMLGANAAVFVTLLRNKRYISISSFLSGRIGRRLVVFLYFFIIFLYFLISYSYFLYTLSTVASNSNCIENVQLHRVVWLVLNYSLRICEVSLLILQFTNTKRLLTMLSRNNNFIIVRSVHSCVNHGTSKVSKLGCNLKVTKESDIIIGRENSQFQKINVVENNSQRIEVERLFHTSNNNVTSDKIVECIQSSQSMSYQSAVPIQEENVLPSIVPDCTTVAVKISHDRSRDTLPNILDGKAITVYLL